ncbi:hypothetical protein KAU08_07025 [bacterium]|nr:hypothetical protein [bacterium]
MRKILSNTGGFTLVEFSFFTAMLGILLAVVLPAHILARDAAKESETKSNLHTIQSAVERFGIDNEEYPAYILGGDREGWDKCRAVTWSDMPVYAPPTDELIAGDYLTAYPRNPFLNEGDGIYTIIPMTGASSDPGNGDVRFGYSGERMGNCLDDPKYLFGDGEFGPGPLRNTMVPINSRYLGIVNNNSPNTFFCMGGLPEWSRESLGASDPEAGWIKYYWPGEFFYRSGGDFLIDIIADWGGESYEDIFGWVYKKIDKYMLGAYGSLRTDGMDVIRLTTKAGLAASTAGGAIQGIIHREYYQDHSNLKRKYSHPDFEARVQYSNPEVFGGGKFGVMPQFPYYESFTYKWIYGASDGFPDGIILVLTGELPMVTVDIGVIEPKELPE